MNNTAEAWDSFVAHWVIVPIATIWLFEGVRRAVARRTGRSSAILAIVGAAFLLGNGGVALWGATSLTSTLDSIFGSPQTLELSDEVLAKLPGDEKAKRSLLLAQMNFANTGLLTEHYAPDGTSVRYVPTEAEIQEREKAREGLAEARARIDQVRTRAFSLFIAAVTAVIAGVFAGRQEFSANGS
jgi:hypothetical protein